MAQKTQRGLRSAGRQVGIEKELPLILPLFWGAAVQVRVQAVAGRQVWQAMHAVLYRERQERREIYMKA